MIYEWRRKDGYRYAHLTDGSRTAACGEDAHRFNEWVNVRPPVQFCARCAQLAPTLTVIPLREPPPKEPRVNPKSAAARTLNLFGGGK